MQAGAHHDRMAAYAARLLAAHPGRGVQVDPMKPMLKAPGYMLLKLRYDGPGSIFAFTFKLRRYTRGGVCSVPSTWVRAATGGTTGRGLHSSTSQLNLSRF
jgi:hypothetical protein